MKMKYICYYLCYCILLYFVKAWSPTSRLQRDAIPKSYTLAFIPNIENETFEGEVTVLIHLQHSLNSITLNSKELIISDITLDQAIGRTTYQLNESAELLHVSYSDQQYINPGEHILNIKFDGRLDRFVGFYSNRFEKNSTTRFFLATKFSAINARSAFPCFDEPYFKSIFSIRLVKPNSTWIALSNMKEIRSFSTSKGIAVDFQSTILMSTYLLSWLLTDYTYEEISYKSNNKIIPLRLFTLEERVDERRILLEYTKAALEFYENYTGLSYPLSKLDSIELPYYMSTGMEHWGLIVYRKGALTYNPSYSLSRLEHMINAVLLIAHEISHMWFGNLVTHEWYNDLWLTEGFARFMQFKAASFFMKEPFMNSMLQFEKLTNLHYNQCGAGRRFATETALFPRDLDSVTSKFVSTTYDQGAAVLMMLEDIMGPENFKEAVRKHLREHQFSYATTGDFINTVQSVVPEINIVGFMETYLFQKKFPVVNVTEEENMYVLQQAPVCGCEQSIFRNKWTIPIKFITSSNRTSRFVWFDKDMTKLYIPKSLEDRWIKINYLNKGLYRTIYADKLLKDLQKDFQELDADDKGSLFQDAFLLASFKNLSCSVPLEMMGYLRNSSDLDYITYSYVTSALKVFLGKIDMDKDVRSLLNLYLAYILEPFHQKLSWIVKSEDSLSQRLLRVNILEVICRDMDYKLCLKDMERITTENLTIHEDIDLIYKEVQRSMKVDSESQVSVKSEEVNVTTVQPTTEAPALKEEDECSTWIRENIPKLLEHTNLV